MPQHRLTDIVTPWIDEAIDAYANGENVRWDSGMTGGPNGEALYTVFFWFPGAVLGETVQGSFRLHDPLGVSKESVDATVKEFLRQLREARSQEIAAQTPQNGAQGPVPGSPRPSGLILP